MKGNVSLVFTRLKERGITSPEKGLDRSTIATLTGLGEQQVSSACHSLAVRDKYLGRNKVDVGDGTKKYIYWVMREPNGKKRRRRTLATTLQSNGEAYKIRIDGPNLLLEQTVRGSVIQQLIGLLVK